MNVYDAEYITIPEGAVKRILDSNNNVLWEMSPTRIPFYIEGTYGTEIYIGGYVDSTISDISISYQYSFDNSNWSNGSSIIYSNSSSNNRYTKIIIPVGGKVYFRATRNAWRGTTYFSPNVGTFWYFYFVSNGVVNIGGNIMSLLYGDGYVGKNTFPSNDGQEFCAVFNGNNINIKYAHNLVLPALTVNPKGYHSMFSHCVNLITAPTIKATTIEKSGCEFMFYDCVKLTTVPDIPTKTLYDAAFSDMFRDCTALVKAPNLSVETMYNNSGSGYGPMQRMFRGCTSLTKAPYLSAATLVTSCYDSMFEGCSSLNEIKCNATNISATGCTNSWVYDVAASGTFYKNRSVSSWPSGISGIPSGWTVRNL